MGHFLLFYDQFQKRQWLRNSDTNFGFGEGRESLGEVRGNVLAKFFPWSLFITFLGGRGLSCCLSEKSSLDLFIMMHICKGLFKKDTFLQILKNFISPAQ